jgi:guanine deaminase
MTSSAAASLILRGHTIALRRDPFAGDPEGAISADSDGALLIESGRIAEMGHASDVIARHPGVRVEAYPGHFILPGFVDAHVHYPQIGVIASYGRQLIEWLSTYTFPAELAFGDPAHAAAMAELYLDECLRNGITAASVYCTVHPQSVEALFAAAERRGMAIAAGKMMMDRNAPPGLCDTPERGYDESAALIARWHGKGRNRYVVSPRFAITSTPEQLDAAGALWRAHPTTLMQTHIDENAGEIAWVRDLFPDEPDYLGVYERFGLVGPGANFGHAIHLTPRERRRFVDTGSGISHCPTSNLFLGSGLCDVHGLTKEGVPIGLGTDVGGGTSFSMFATMRAAYEIAQLRGVSLHPVEALWLATQGGAKVLGMADRIGNLAPGYDADVIVVDPASTPLIAARMSRVRDVGEALFAQMVLADDRAIRAVYVAGRLAYERPGGTPMGARGDT